MQRSLERVMELQPSWSHQNTPEMAERGLLIRRTSRDWLRSFSEEIAQAVRIPLDDLLIEGRDGTGPKTEVPWFRFSSKKRSPSATIGWYCVYLFDTAGKFAYLCLSHGSTDWQDGNFVPRPHDELRSLAAWARTSLNARGAVRSDLIQDIKLLARRTELGPAYEASTAFAIRYPRIQVPGDTQLKSDALFMASLLGDIYQLEAEVPIPVGVPPEVQELEDAVAAAAGKKERGGQGFRLNAAQRKAIEMHAMELARIELERRGCSSIRDTSKGNPFDYQCSLEGRDTFVEVKGTVSSGEVVILTRGEVELHRAKYPNNMLIVVHGIQLGGESGNEATGGKIKVTNPWAISQESLSVVAYNYRTSH